MDALDFKLAGGGILGRILPKRVIGRKAARVAAIAIAWVPLLVICLIAGTAAGKAVDVPFFGDHVVQVRYLISLPILMAAGFIINRRLSDIVSYLWNSDILVGDDRNRFQAAVREVTRRCGAIVPDIVILIVVYALAWAISSAGPPDGVTTWAYAGSGPDGELSAAGWWSALVSLPLWQFALIRWAWRIFFWCRFLQKVSRLDLKLTPTHPDRAGGLGILQMGQTSLAPLVFSVAAVLSASLAFSMHHGDLTLPASAPTICVFAVLALLFIIGPLFVFVPKLVGAKRKGLVEYGDLADDLFGAFDAKWIRKSDEEQRKLLGDPDPSSLSDFGYAYEIVTEMRIVPFGRRNLTAVAIAILIPFVPLLLVEHSVKEILQRIAGLLF